MTNRNYSKERTFGDIVYNIKTETVFFNIDMGFMGKKSINLVQNQEGTYDMFATYFKDGKPQMYKMGKTFQVKNKEGQIIEGITKGTIGLRTSYDKTIFKFCNIAIKSCFIHRQTIFYIIIRDRSVSL